MKLEVIRARINLKSLAAEAKFIRREIKKTGNEYYKNDLNLHKVNRLRPEARLANLAMAFLRGLKRSDVERSYKEEISTVQLVNKLNKFLGYYDQIKDQNIIKEWLKT